MSDVAEKLMAIRNRSLEQKPNEPTPQDSKEAVPEKSQEVENTTEQVEQTEATTVEKVEDVGSPEEAVSHDTVTGWDDDDSETEVQPSSEIKIEEWVSDLGFDGIKTKEELKTKVSELRTKLKTLEENPIAGIPEEFREIIKVAKTGDWKDYLASQIIDFTKLDPIEEFEMDFRARAQQNPKYFTDGKFDYQKVEEALDTMPEAVREYNGVQLLQAKAAQQQRHKEALQAKAEANLAEAEKNLATATRSLGELLPLETYGIKFEPKHSSAIYNGITNSKLTKKHTGMSYEDLVRSGADMKSVVKTIAMAEYGEKMIAYRADKSKVTAKKELLKSVQNVQLNTSGTNLNPEDPEKKVVSPVELLRKHITQSRKGL